MGGTDYRAETFCLSVECRMVEKAAGKYGDFDLFDAHVSDAVSLVAQIALIEARVKCNESWMPETAQERDDLIILHPFPPYVVADLAD